MVSGSTCMSSSSHLSVCSINGQTSRDSNRLKTLNLLNSIGCCDSTCSRSVHRREGGKREKGQGQSRIRGLVGSRRSIHPRDKPRHVSTASVSWLTALLCVRMAHLHLLSGPAVAAAAAAAQAAAVGQDKRGGTNTTSCLEQRQQLQRLCLMVGGDRCHDHCGVNEKRGGGGDTTRLGRHKQTCA